MRKNRSHTTEKEVDCQGGSPKHSSTEELENFTLVIRDVLEWAAGLAERPLPLACALDGGLARDRRRTERLLALGGGSALVGCGVLAGALEEALGLRWSRSLSLSFSLSTFILPADRMEGSWIAGKLVEEAADYFGGGSKEADGLPDLASTLAVGTAARVFRGWVSRMLKKVREDRLP